MVDQREATGTSTDAVPTERQWARIRLEKRRKLRADAVAYAVINTALVVAWALTGFGYFWPAWSIGIWGVFLLLDAWNLDHRRPVTEAEIDEELRRNG